jgi:hypothetical protein
MIPDIAPRLAILLLTEIATLKTREARALREAMQALFEAEDKPEADWEDAIVGLMETPAWIADAQAKYADLREKAFYGLTANQRAELEQVLQRQIQDRMN